MNTGGCPSRSRYTGIAETMSAATGETKNSPGDMVFTRSKNASLATLPRCF